MKMYAVLRNDIWMDAGKAAAQAGHAFAHVTMLSQIEYPERLQTYLPEGYRIAGTKVALGATYKEIQKLRSECSELNLPQWTMFDNGHVFLPHFDGKHDVLTAMGIGPLFMEEAEKLLGDLKLFTVNEGLKKKRKI